MASTRTPSREVVLLEVHELDAAKVPGRRAGHPGGRAGLRSSDRGRRERLERGRWGRRSRPRCCASWAALGAASGAPPIVVPRVIALGLKAGAEASAHVPGAGIDHRGGRLRSPGERVLRRPLDVGLDGEMHVRGGRAPIEDPQRGAAERLRHQRPRRDPERTLGAGFTPSRPMAGRPGSRPRPGGTRPRPR